ncbi:hypothetical protein ACS15_5515 [Ralstonia insidiosa]|uniref:ABC transporter substrate-binding protein n=1 Tax=Ralstonia insidiosa TaxID=190721 RepID=A0AAC9FUL0_9RALS|nr:MULTISPECIES: DUF2076 family protein [Ralstonia]ANH76592.1 hypothetical protein ACS15_5515 [Ralstonia insidiosa]EPX99565.1 ABC transporter substrate-binding protein [Ralstonia sp. AU12-08]MBY4705100.1 DUF2076 family protein [Ralstonia insidiosa]GAQ29228.1 periplasmic ligand-binding sensor protein [Ralstonia sp. NT80]
MSPQEQQALENFLAQLTQARAGAKDPQAEARILEAVARQPDAAYLLVQRAMLLDHALASAQAQIAALQNQLQAAQAGRSTSFMDSANNWGSHATSAAPNPAYVPQQAAPMQMPQQAQPVQQAPAQPVRSGFFSGGLGSTLGSVATTAAGVAGGALLFQGIENMFHHNSGGGGFFGQQPLMGGTTETVINNYYDSDSGNSNGNTASRDDSLGLVDDSDLGGSDYSDDDSTLI